MFKESKPLKKLSERLGIIYEAREAVFTQSKRQADILGRHTHYLSILGFKPIPECATLDSRVSDQERICDFIY